MPTVKIKTSLTIEQENLSISISKTIKTVNEIVSDMAEAEKVLQPLRKMLMH